MNDKIRQEAMHIHNWCTEQCDCVHCDFGRDNRTCKISGIPAQWFDDEDHSANAGKKAETRQERFLEMFPHADVRNGVLAICPGNVDVRLVCNEQGSCRGCLKEYWLAKEEKS